MAFSSRVARALLIALLGSAAFAPSLRAASLPPGGLDPREEITPEELASIPEPVPAVGRLFVDRSKHAPKAAAGVPGPLSTDPPIPAPPSTPAVPPSPPESSATAASPVAGGPWIWRVQILATPEKALAGQVAREAAERLGTTSRVDHEAALYKVRLGGFGSEGDAQILKARAVEMGYPGAFRVKIHAAATDE